MDLVSSGPLPGFTGGDGTYQSLVQGLVRDSGEPTGSVTVSLYLVQPRVFQASTTTDANGAYSLGTGLTSGTCVDGSLEAKHPDGRMLSDTLEICQSLSHDFDFPASEG